MSDVLLGLALLALLLVAYLIPALVAELNRHPHAAPILVLNVLLGWTLLGWVVALVWALTLPARRA